MSLAAGFTKRFMTVENIARLIPEPVTQNYKKKVKNSN